MTNATPITTQFNAGELSPLMSGRVDTAFYGKGCRALRNMIPLPQGAAKRRGGTRYLGDAFNAATPSLMIAFVRSATESYVLELGNRFMRFWYNGGLLTIAPNVPYVIGTVYAASELFNADGTPAIQVTQSADVMYFTHRAHPVQKLSHFGTLNWIMAAPTFKDGPWLGENTDDAILVYLSDITGSVTITAAADMFDVNCVGQLVRVYQNDLSQLKAWYPGQRSSGGAIEVGQRRRSGNNTYVCKSVEPGSVPEGGTVDWVETGSDTLIATLGDQWDGPQDVVPNPATANHYYGRGVQWTYCDSGYGVGVITARTDARHVTIEVLRQFPLSLKAGEPSFIASKRWQLGAWSVSNGYPSACCFFRERLTFAGGIYAWGSVAGDFENFADNTFGEVTQDNAFTQQVLSDQVNKIQWLDPSDDLLVGTLGSEHVITSNTNNEPFGPQNIATKKESGYGSRAVRPIRIGGSTLFVTRTGRFVREFVYDLNNDGYKSADLTLPSEHITQGGVNHMVWAQNPDQVIWMTLTTPNAAGTNLIGFTYNIEQEVKGWHNHPLGGTDVLVKSIAVVPSIAGDYDEVHLCVKRTINGTTRYTIERLEQAWRSGDAKASAFYVDCGATYNGPPAPTVTGLTWLEGATVQIFADGQPQTDKTVLNGFITLDAAASVVQVGLHCPAILQPMRIEAGGTDGTSQGKIKRIVKSVWRFVNALGGKFGRDVLDGSPLDDMQYGDAPNSPIVQGGYYTGDTPLLAWPGGYEQEGYIGYINDQPLPVTICAIITPLVTYEGWG